MWGNPETDLLFNEMCLVACKKHEGKAKKLSYFSKLGKKNKKIFWVMKIHVMDPFFYNTPYCDIPDNWLKNSRFLPTQDPVVNSCHLNSELKEKIILFDTISTHTLALLCRVCGICKDLDSEEDLVNYYDMNISYEQGKNLGELENLQLKDAFIYISKLPIYEEVRRNFVNCDGSTLNIAILISYYFFLETSNDPNIAIAHFDDVIKNIRSKHSNLRFLGNEEYNKHNYSSAVEAYTLQLKTDYYNYLCYGNRAQCFLKLNQFLCAELDCRAAIILQPEWCKGHYRLAEALVGQKKLNKALSAVEFGLKMCSSLRSSSEYTSLMEYKKTLLKESKMLSNNSNESVVPMQVNKSIKKIVPPDFDDIMDVPELTDSSSSSGEETEDDEEKEINAKLGVKEKAKEEEAKNIPLDVKQVLHTSEDIIEMEEQSKMNLFHDYLSEGSSAMANGNCFLARQHFHDALVKWRAQTEFYELDNKAVVSLKYAFAISSCKSGIFENLEEAVTTFKEIINEHSEVKFPAAYYGLALSCFKLKDFKESLQHLKTLSSELEKIKENSEMYYWPGTKDLIEEMSYPNLKVLLEELQKECESPPPPDAVCLYEKCSFSPSIYVSAPDHKGFMSIHCNERCLLQYHMSCWKYVKETFNKTDKEFINLQCLTPDCDGFIIMLEIYGKDGVVDKSFESEERITKKGAKHKRTKLEKKFQIKEQRKLKRHKSESHDKPEELPEQTEEISSQHDSLKQEEEKMSKKEKEKASTPETVHNTHESAPKSIASDSPAQPLYVISRKDDDKPSEVKSKYKEKKKQKKPTYTIDEFCGDTTKDVSYYNEYQVRLHRLQETRRVIEENEENVVWKSLCTTDRIPDLDPKRPFHIPEGLRNDPCTLEKVLQHCGTVPQNEDAEEMKEFIYSRFENILLDSGPINVNDPVITEELNDLPEKWQEMIKGSGGFNAFMLQSMKFAVVDDTLCFFSDMMNLYKPSSQINELDNFNQVYGSSDDISLGTSTLIPPHVFKLEENISELNPNAAEYSPSNSRSDLSLNCAGIRATDSNSEEFQSNFESSATVEKTRASETRTIEHVSTNDDFSSIAKQSLLSTLTNLRKPLLNCSLPSLANISDSTAENSLNATGGEIKSFLSKFSELRYHLCSSNDLCAAFDTMLNISVELNRQGYAEKVRHFFTNNGGRLISHQKLDKCEQTGCSQANLVSSGQMTDNDGFKEIQKSYEDMQKREEYLIQHSGALEQQLCEALASNAKLENKLGVDLPALEKQISENSAANKEKCEGLKNKVTVLEKELRQWRLKYDELADKEKECSKENAKLNVKLNHYRSKLEDMEKQYEQCENKISRQNEILEIREEAFKENSLALTEKLKECSEANERAVNSEIHIINTLKNSYLEKLDIIIKEGSIKIQDLQKNLVLSEKNLSPIIAYGLKSMVAKLKEHAAEISKIRFSIVDKAEELISKLRCGIPYSELEAFPFPTLPEMPGIDEFPYPSSSAPPLPSQQYPLHQNIPGAPKHLLTQPNHLPNLLQGCNNPGKLFPPHLQSSLASFSSSSLGGPASTQIPFQNTWQNSFDFNFYSGAGSAYPSMWSQATPSSTQMPSGDFSSVPGASASIPVSTPSTIASQGKSNIESNLCTTETVPVSDKTESDVEKSKPKVADWKPASSQSESRPLSPPGPSLSRCSSVSSGYAKSTQEGDDGASVNSSLRARKSNNVSCDSLRENGSMKSQAESMASSSHGARPKAAAHLELNYSAKNKDKGLAMNSSAPVPSCASKETNSQVSAPVQKASEKKGNYVKIIDKLLAKHPEFSEEDLFDFIKKFREEKGRLTGMTVETIVGGVSELIRKSSKFRPPVIPVMRARTIVNKPLVSAPPPPEPPKLPIPSSSGNPWKKASADSSHQWSGENSDNCCIICLEEMTKSTSMKVQCGHQFHRHCIKQWVDKTSNCPTCRVHLLLPEDYPALS